MVATRGSRKRRGAESADDNGNGDDNGPLPSLVDEGAVAAAEAALEAAERDRKDRTKRRRTAAFKRNHPPVTVLQREIWERVLLFLDSSRDVANFANCSQYLRGVVTPEIVVRAAIFGGGRTNAAAAGVATLVEKRAIHAPSTFRLLRLVNGTRCERGAECYGYDLLQKKAALLPKHGGSEQRRFGVRPYGLCICPACVRVVSCPLVPSSWRSGPKHFTHEDGSRVVVVDYTRILVQPQTEAATGEATGPLVVAKHVRQIESTYAAPEDRKAALAGVLEAADDDADEDADSAADRQKRADALVAAYSAAEEEFPAFVQAKANVVNKKTNALWEERFSKKNKNIRAVLSRLEDLLEDYEHMDIVLETSVRTQWGDCRFLYGPSQAILGSLVSAPSSATQKKVAAAVVEVKEVYDLLHSHGFLGVSGSEFLPFLSQRHRSEQALRRHCLQNFSANELLKLKGGFSVERSAVERTGRYTELLRTGKPIAALCCLLGPHGTKEAFSARIVTDRDPVLKNKYTFLANRVWLRPLDGVGEARRLDEAGEYRKRFVRSRNEYRTLYQNFQDYLATPSTAAFLERTDPPAHIPSQRFTRRNAVHKTLEAGRGEDMLRSRDFAGLLGLHRRMFQNPNQFGYLTHHAG